MINVVISSILHVKPNGPIDIGADEYYPVTGIKSYNSSNYPSKFVLYQNFPNPFNPKTVISWQSAVDSDVELIVYNLRGQKVATLVSEKQTAGYHQVEFNAQQLSSGVYLYKIQAGEFQDVRKMLLIK